ncbi:allantoinase PuuE [Lichenifustis flavocetrariae]|uniref:Chitooligosaccharide deacetylase n=1 Tax=Lichenifustis flavocetrariae TaxID=2949735 RepID=A0AA41YZ51_9HYPH|nr:allantoinase PuuE [Lichenifustis flavocetrariae]MCW6511256.1 allantoinase PuuE [Lichenifustis flavocetrariae]
MIPRSLDRDFVGYGPTPPDPRWPSGARLALNFVLNYEEGSEYSMMDKDGVSDAALTEIPAAAVPRGERDLAAESMFEYGSRVGFWRLHRLFQERGLPMTVYACALALERNLPAGAAIKAAGYDICCHGWRWVEHFKLSEDTEREHIRLAVESLQRTVGQRPDGWYCRYGPSVNTRRLVMQEGGFLYDSDSYADELPYYVMAEGRPQLVVPYTLTNNDLKWGTGNLGSGEDFFVILREAFDLLYEEGRTAPKMMNVGMHMRLLGHPGRASGLARFLDYVKSKPDVWVAKRIDIARHWLKEHPPEVSA